jgi:hypothetical protein
MMDEFTRRDALKLAAAGVATAGVGGAAAAAQADGDVSADHVARIEARINEVNKAIAGCSDSDVDREMLLVVRKPGFTSKAESMLVMAALDSMHSQATALAAHKKSLLKGCQAVGEK